MIFFRMKLFLILILMLILIFLLWIRVLERRINLLLLVDYKGCLSKEGIDCIVCEVEKYKVED